VVLPEEELLEDDELLVGKHIPLLYTCVLVVGFILKHIGSDLSASGGGGVSNLHHGDVLPPASQLKLYPVPLHLAFP
jgi:hypothetical protein